LESRRVVLLTEGHLRGWLDLVDETPFSSLRREILLQVTERRLVAEVMQLRLQVTCSLAGARLAHGALSRLSTDLESWVGMALPYLLEKSRIGNSPGAEKLNDPEFWRDVLKQARESRQKPKLAAT
jgi:hypothetical protein